MIQYLLMTLCLRAVTATPLDSRVVGGEEASPHSWPWQASLQFAYDFDPDFFQHMCAGSLVTPNWVLTAGHCIVDVPGRFAVMLGEHDLYQKGNEYLRHIKTIIIHPEFNPDVLANGNDIALLRMAEPAYSTPDVEIANLAEPGSILPNGYPCYVTGWGLTEPFGIPSATLQEANLAVVDYATCSSPYWWSGVVTPNMICAGGDGKSGGCQGDSGGPLNCMDANGVWRVHGIVSFGPGSCIVAHYPTVFTRISAYNDWISKTMEQNGGV
ncbi:chymotrypsin-like elastase family member 2A [Leucoraja erinacea]|uniref:chymotrypsin-like elastase family member 2A n=1 Tax=Leucoraja erinaceus TaxID=7782 RepID=UPI0024555EA7|nr:chymotrypsin-like elastase family member 2A [Leucoraja erinacea]